MGLGDLTTQHQADAGAARLGGEEGHEEVLGIGQPGPFVADRDLECPVGPPPTHLDPAAGLERRLDAVLDQVDQQLLELVGVGLDGDLRTGDQALASQTLKTMQQIAQRGVDAMRAKTAS